MTLQIALSKFFLALGLFLSKFRLLRQALSVAFMKILCFADIASESPSCFEQILTLQLHASLRVVTQSKLALLTSFQPGIPEPDTSKSITPAHHHGMPPFFHWHCDTQN